MPNEATTVGPVSKVVVAKSRASSNSSLRRAIEEARGQQRMRLLIRKADVTRNGLMFITRAMLELLRDEKFVALLKAENLDTIPQKLAARMKRRVLPDGEKS